jgi:hypothetical protein
MKIKLNKDFYNKQAIEEALNDFEGVCKGKILNEDMEVELQLKEENKNIKQEFCNYVLGLMKNKIMV